jgi:hypothetical protein
MFGCWTKAGRGKFALNSNHLFVDYGWRVPPAPNSTRRFPPLEMRVWWVWWGMRLPQLSALLLAPLVISGLSCQSEENPKFRISVHSQSSEDESPRSIMPDFIGNPPRRVILKRSPEFTQKNIAAFHAFPADNGNGNGVALQLDFSGTQALELATRMSRGQILRTLVNGRPAAYVVIDKPISDGIFVIWEGVPDEVVRQMAKTLPSIRGLESSSRALEMTPSTRAEKKASMKSFRKSRDREQSEDEGFDSPWEGGAPLRGAAAPAPPEPMSPPAMTERERAAAIQPPLLDMPDTMPRIDPLAPLPEP